MDVAFFGQSSCWRIMSSGAGNGIDVGIGAGNVSDFGVGAHSVSDVGTAW